MSLAGSGRSHQVWRLGITRLDSFGVLGLWADPSAFLARRVRDFDLVVSVGWVGASDGIRYSSDPAARSAIGAASRSQHFAACPRVTVSSGGSVEHRPCSLGQRPLKTHPGK